MTHTQIFVMRIRIRRRPSRPTRRASSLSDGQPLTRTLRRLTRAFSGYSQPLFLHVWLANCRAQSLEPSAQRHARSRSRYRDRYQTSSRVGSDSLDSTRLRPGGRGLLAFLPSCYASCLIHNLAGALETQLEHWRPTIRVCPGCTTSPPSGGAVPVAA